jgi:hypothetical protein
MEMIIVDRKQVIILKRPRAMIRGKQIRITELGMFTAGANRQVIENLYSELSLGVRAICTSI